MYIIINIHIRYSHPATDQPQPITRFLTSPRIKTGGLDDLLLNRSWELCCTLPFWWVGGALRSDETNDYPINIHMIHECLHQIYHNISNKRFELFLFIDYVMFSCFLYFLKKHTVGWKRIRSTWFRILAETLSEHGWSVSGIDIAAFHFVSDSLNMCCCELKIVEI